MAKTREEAYQTAQRLIEKGNGMLGFPLSRKTSRDGKTVIEPGKWTFADAARLMDTALKLKALATGLPTDRTEHTGPEGAAIPVAVNAGQVVIYVPADDRD
jgi:hypothetical protein